jgi:multiple sugar transport system substrate-binding protein
MSAAHTPPGEISRRAAIGVGAVGLLTALAGCARGSSTRPAAAGYVTLDSDNGTWGPGWAAASKPLKASTGYALQPRSVPNVGNYQQIVRMSSQTGATTDLVKWWNGYRLQDLARGDVLSPLDDAWDQAIERGWVDGSLRKSFQYAGRTFGMPLYKSYYPVFYDKGTFSRLGLDVPTTWDEFIAVAKRLKEASVVPITAPGASTWESLIWFQQLVAGLDPTFYQDLTNGRASYSDATARDALDVWAGMYADGLFSPPDAQTTTIPGLVDKQQFGMYVYGTFTINALLAAGVTGRQMGLFMLPPVRSSARPSIFIESGALCVPSNAHKRDAALRVAGDWLSAPVQQGWVDFLGDTSPNPRVLPERSFVSDIAAIVQKDRPLELTRYWEASPPALVEANVQSLGSFMVHPTPRNAVSTLAEMQRKAVTEWKTWRAA